MPRLLRDYLQLALAALNHQGEASTGMNCFESRPVETVLVGNEDTTQSNYEISLN